MAESGLTVAAKVPTHDVIRAGRFVSGNNLVRDLETDLRQPNVDPKPYVWRAADTGILARIERARAARGKATAAWVFAW